MNTPENIKHLILSGLEASDPDTLERYAEHAADNLEAATVCELMLALIKEDAPGIGIALNKMEMRIKRQRSEFVDFEVMRMGREIERMGDEV